MRRTSGLSTVAVKELGQQRLEREEGNANQARHGMRAVQNRVILNIKQHKATLSSEEEEKKGEAHQRGVELASGLSTELDFAIPIADFPSEEGAERGHSRQNDAPIGVGMKWLEGKVGESMSGWNQMKKQDINKEGAKGLSHRHSAGMVFIGR